MLKNKKRKDKSFGYLLFTCEIIVKSACIMTVTQEEFTTWTWLERKLGAKITSHIGGGEFDDKKYSMVVYYSCSKKDYNCWDVMAQLVKIGERNEAAVQQDRRDQQPLENIQ